MEAGPAADKTHRTVQCPLPQPGGDRGRQALHSFISSPLVHAVLHCLLQNHEDSCRRADKLRFVP